jgi:type II secretory pathway pseudopilin PulG
LIELLIVVAIIGVMASMVVASFANATQDARGVVVLQQQAVLQEALNTWISRESSGTGSLAGARTTYAAATTAALKVGLIESYLSDSTAGQLEAHASIGDALNTDAMKKTGQYVTFSAWAVGDYPKVEMR